MQAALVIVAKVVDDVQAERLVEPAVFGRKPMQGVGAEYQPPTGPPPAGGAITPEITEVGHSLKRHPSFGRDDRTTPTVGRDRNIVTPGGPTDIVDADRSLTGRHCMGVNVVDGLRARTDTDVDTHVVAIEGPSHHQAAALRLHQRVNHCRGHGRPGYRVTGAGEVNPPGMPD